MCTLYWSKTPGQFVNKKTGVLFSTVVPVGEVRKQEWITTLVDTMLDVRNMSLLSNYTGAKDLKVLPARLNPEVFLQVQSDHMYEPTTGILCNHFKLIPDASLLNEVIVDPLGKVVILD